MFYIVSNKKGKINTLHKIAAYKKNLLMLPEKMIIIRMNYLPLSMNDYIQQTGRAGRVGGKAHCILLYSSEDFWMASTLVEPYENARLNESLRQMMTYCEDREHCLKHLMLEALGQATGKKCRFCTNCQAGRR